MVAAAELGTLAALRDPQLAGPFDCELPVTEIDPHKSSVGVRQRLQKLDAAPLLHPAVDAQATGHNSNLATFADFNAKLHKCGFQRAGRSQMSRDC